MNGTDGLSKRLGADMLVLPSGYDSAIEGILLRSEPSTVYMDQGWLDKISRVTGITATSPQLFIASFSADCCSVPIQMIGFDQGSDFIVWPWIKTSLPGVLGDDEIVIGGMIGGRPGGTLKFFGREYIIAAKMENTGTGFDASVFMNMSAARGAASDRAALTGETPPPDGVISSIAALIGDDLTPSVMADRIYSEFGYGKSGIAVVPAKKIVGNVSSGLRTLTSLAVVFGIALWLVCVLVMAVIFSVTLNERKREFGIMRSLGMTRKKLAVLVFLESAATSVSGGIIGILSSALIIIPFRVYIQQKIGMPYMIPSPAQFLGAAVCCLILSAATGPLSSLRAAVKIGTGGTYDIIREGEA
jgi:putative ABC transport system permease protein